MNDYRFDGRERRFHSLYWQQLLLTVGTVLLALTLLGVTFFHLSFQAGRSQFISQLREHAVSMSFLAGDYAADHHLPDFSALTAEEEFYSTARSAAAISSTQFLLCDDMGRILLSVPALPEDSPKAVPYALTMRIQNGENVSVRSDLGGLYNRPCYAVGVQTSLPDSGGALGEVFAVSSVSTINHVWYSFFGFFLMTALVVLLLAVLASTYAAMRVVLPLREMSLAIRRFAAGSFELHMESRISTDELGELAESLNLMADALRRQEEQRREFVSNLSHDLKTPLTSIAGYTDGILDGTIPPEKEKPYLRIISDESRRLSRLVRRMLDASQIQSVDPLRSGARFDLCECLRQVLISLEERITARNLDVEADIPEEPILAYGDLDMITQVVYNLLENAAKFAAEGSVLYLGVEEAAGRARVTVRNSGKTIPEEELPKLFERFHKSDQSRSEDKDGVGLGLYIVKTILDQHREKIYVKSENGVTTFSFALRTRQGGIRHGFI